MTPAEFKTRFPEFASETDARVQILLDDAAPAFEVDRWDTYYSAGVSNYVAHKLAVANAQAAGGTAGLLADDKTMKKVGDLQVQRSEAALLRKMDDPFMTTTYGQEYRRLMKLVGAGISAV